MRNRKMSTRTLSSKNYTAYCRTHALPKNIPAPVIDFEPQYGNAYTSIHHGAIGNHEIQVKVWRGSPMDNATRDRFIIHLVKELDDWKRASGHSNITPFLGLVDGVSWECLPSLVTPLYSNGNINQYLRKNPQANVLSLLHNVANALAYMHGLSPPVVHGGVRGANILIADDGEAHLSDLCMSFLPHAPDIAVAGDGLDAERWMAPEILDPTPELQGYYNITTPKTDVYSFGMTMLELYSGCKPYMKKRHTASVICAVVDGIRPPRPNAVSLTDDIWALIRLCWAQDPRDRPTMELIRSSIHTLLLRDFSSSYVP